MSPLAGLLLRHLVQAWWELKGAEMEDREHGNSNSIVHVVLALAILA